MASPLNVPEFFPPPHFVDFDRSETSLAAAVRTLSLIARPLRRDGGIAGCLDDATMIDLFVGEGFIHDEIFVIFVCELIAVIMR